MQFVPESIIDKTVENLGAAEDLNTIVEDFKSHQPVLLAYLFSENFELLTQKEREFMLFLSLVIWKSCESKQTEIFPVEQSMLEELEENNWAKLNKTSSGKFNERIDVFFNDYPQEDLLAFVEDALAYDDNDEVTKEGRGFIFVALKTVIDCLDKCGLEKKGFTKKPQ